jgi:hypothetical protein
MIKTISILALPFHDYEKFYQSKNIYIHNIQYDKSAKYFYLKPENFHKKNTTRAQKTHAGAQ